jgi:hypothetical protein
VTPSRFHIYCAGMAGVAHSAGITDGSSRRPVSCRFATSYSCNHVCGHTPPAEPRAFTKNIVRIVHAKIACHEGFCSCQYYDRLVPSAKRALRLPGPMWRPRRATDEPSDNFTDRSHPAIRGASLSRFQDSFNDSGSTVTRSFRPLPSRIVSSPRSKLMSFTCSSAHSSGLSAAPLQLF